MPDQFFVIVSQGSFLCLIIRDHYHFATNTRFSTISYPPNQRHPLVLKKAALILGSNPSLMFRNKSASNIFGNFQAKHQWWTPFYVYLQAFLGVF